MPDSISLEHASPDILAIRWRIREFNFKQLPNDLVDTFASLASAEPEEILKFATRYGVLGLDENAEFQEKPHHCAGVEPIELWRSIAGQVKAIIAVAALLHSDGAITPENIAAMGARSYDLLHTVPMNTPEKERRRPFYSDKPFPASKTKRAEIAQECLDRELRRFLVRFSSTITFERIKGEIELRLQYDNGIHGMLSVIGLQLLQAVARRSVYFCSECKLPFVRFGGSNLKRKPRENVDRYCDRCGRDAALRRADERRRAKIANAKRLATEGATPSDIATRLGVRKVATVQNWLKKGRRIKNGKARST